MANELNIVVGVDGSKDSVDALRWAAGLADRRGGRVRAVVAWHYPYLATIPGFSGPVPPAEMMAAGAASGIDEALSEIELPVEVPVEAVQGDAASVLVAESRNADLVVVARTGRSGIARLLLGSTAAQCARHAECPVAVVPAGSEWSDQLRAFVAVDGSAPSVAGLRWALGQVGSPDALTAGYAHDEAVLDRIAFDDELRLQLQQQAEQLLESVVTTAADSGVDTRAVQRVVVAGDPREVLLDAAEGSDVLIVGAQGHTGIAGRVLGSFAEHAITHASMPVIVVR